MSTLRPPDVVQTLGLALIAASFAPLLLLNDELEIVAASASFCRIFQIDPAMAVGRTLPQLGTGEWAAPQLQSLLEATTAGHAGIGPYEMDLVRPGQSLRHLVLHAQILHYDDPGVQLLLLAISDVTEARVVEKRRDDLLHEKSLLLQELQHRVANSLQIIASVLMQSARRVQSEESRTHLHDAHHRVMSVAAMQRQLALSQQGEVALRPYLNELCRSIGASMIRDHTQLSLESVADDSVTTADASMSLGLIVTELAINALKHAFPHHRHGTIKVFYKASGTGWALSVVDDGIGMPKGHEQAKAGLGTNIIAALAKQLDAEIVVSDTGPGTTVTITHAATPAAHPAL